MPHGTRSEENPARPCPCPVMGGSLPKQAAWRTSGKARLGQEQRPPAQTHQPSPRATQTLLGMQEAARTPSGGRVNGVTEATSAPRPRASLNRPAWGRPRTHPRPSALPPGPPAARLPPPRTNKTHSPRHCPVAPCGGTSDASSVRRRRAVMSSRRGAASRPLLRAPAHDAAPPAVTAPSAADARVGGAGGRPRPVSPFPVGLPPAAQVQGVSAAGAGARGRVSHVLLCHSPEPDEF